MLEEKNNAAMWDAYAELAHLENIDGADEAARRAIAQMIAGAMFLTATIGKARADQVVRALASSQTGDVQIRQLTPARRT